jgi:hypothetical protein
MWSNCKVRLSTCCKATLYSNAAANQNVTQLRDRTDDRSDSSSLAFLAFLPSASFQTSIRSQTLEIYSGDQRTQQNTVMSKFTALVAFSFYLTLVAAMEAKVRLCPAALRTTGSVVAISGSHASLTIPSCDRPPSSPLVSGYRQGLL